MEAVKIKMYNCNICPYSNKNAGTLSHHKKTHNPEQIPCDVCSKVFISRAYMQGHKSSVHSTEECPICSKMIQKTNFINHKRKHEGHRYECTFCSKSYWDQGSLHHHKKIHLVGQIEENIVKEFHEKKPRKNKSIACKSCGKTFSSNATLNNHISEFHLTDRNVVCDKCPKRFSTISVQREHARKQHKAKEVRFACKKCEKSYICVTGLKDHMKRVHSEEVNYHCKYCGKGFKVARVLKKHMISLHEQKVTPKACTVCGKMLFTKNSQQVHPKSHIEYEKVKCNICPKMFKPSVLVSHMKYHELSPITCDICNKKVKGQTALVEHKRIHFAQIKDHQCAVCKKKFISQRRVQEHQVIHTTEKPFKCPRLTCSKSYNNSGSRFKHSLICLKNENGL